MQEIYAIRHGKIEKVVDCVIFIDSHSQAEVLVQLAQKHNVVL